MNTFQLQCFLSVVDTLNFARAAEELNVTQPAVSHQINSLESELNVKLFRRTTRSVEITPAGSIFINDAKNMIAIFMRARKRFTTPYEQEIQTFSIGCHNYSFLFLLPSILKELSQIYPQLHPKLQVVPFKHLYRLLDEEDVDGIIGFQETEAKKAPGNYKEFIKVPISCVCSCEHPLASRKSVKLSELGKEKLILNDPAKSPAKISQLQGLLMGARSPADFYFCESTEASLVLVQAGYGISVLPDLCTPAGPFLVRVPVEDLDPISFGIYYKTLHGNAPLKSFIKIMKEFFPH